MNPLMTTVLSYLAVLLMALFVANILTKGFFFRYLRAKMGKRKGKVIVFFYNNLFYFEKVGTYREGWLTVKDRDKATRRIAVPVDCTRELLGVICIDIDEESNNVLHRNFKTVSGFDAVKFEELYQRALNRSRLNDFKKQLQIILIVVCLIGLFSIINIVMLNSFKKNVMVALSYCDLRTLGNMTTNLGSNVITGGNVV
ncbi:MAG: hypothetical protein ACP5N3_04150 [Candidatus Nanoarchaeia archaeon]